MKKTVSLLLALIMLLSVISVELFAVEEGENLLAEEDSTFESGETNWYVFGNAGSIDIVEAPDDGEGNALCFTIDVDAFEDKGNTWQGPAIDIRPIIQSKITEPCTLVISLDCYREGAYSFPLTMRAKLEELSLAKEKNTAYPRLGNIVGNSEWVTVEGVMNITEEDLKVTTGKWELCLDGLPKTGDDEFVYIDNISITVAPPKEDEPLPEIKNISRQKDFLMGTIRWDAFFSTDSKVSNVSRQVAKALSPAEHHYKVPFFGAIDEAGNVTFPGYTMEVWEKETEYAVDAGFDYFAYLWYETTDPMSEPRKLHLQSSKKNSIKMCGIVESIRSDKTMNELYSAMHESCYLRVDGRPVLFLYQFASSWNDKKVNEIRQAAVNAGIKEALYIVGMVGTTNDIMKAETGKYGADAYSWYATGAGGTAVPYVKNAEKCETRTQSLGAFAFANGKSLIPCVSTGYDTSPRIKNPVTWITGDINDPDPSKWPYGNQYTLKAEAEDIATHLKNMVAYVKDNPDITKPNMLLSYAWNEHDEGGWFCPTLAVDENGNVLYNEDGTAKINTERLDAVKKVLNAAAENTATAEAVSTPQVTETPAGNVDNEKGFNVQYVIIPAAVVVAAAVVAVIAIKKKKAE